jgi:hypothetical protein
MQRRTFVAAALAAASARAGVNRIDRSRLSAITDEVAATPEDAIAFAKQYKLEWLALRTVPGTKIGYWSMEPADLAAAARQFKDAGIRISFLDTSLLKFGLPGTEPVRKTPEEPAAKEKRIAREQAQFDRHLDDLGKAVRACRAFGANMLRIFTFSRVAQPETVFPRIREILNAMAVVAEREGVKLLIENEGSQNCGTCAETAALLTGVPSPAIGINWDTTNGVPLGEKAFPDGYEAMPKERILNVHMKGKSLLDYPERLDWTAIVRRLEKDGYTGKLELETHVANDQRIAASHASIKEIIRVLEPS